MSSWEVGALWDKPGSGHRTEKPVTGDTGLQRTDRQVTYCSTHEGIIHTCYEVNGVHLALLRTQTGQGLEEGYWMKGT